MRKKTKLVDPENYPNTFDGEGVDYNKKTPCKSKDESINVLINWDHETEESVLRVESRIIFLQWIASVSIVLSALTVLFVGLHK